MYRIFIVEDDVGIAQGITNQLKLWDFDVVCVQDFRNVMSEFAQSKPHLVLMDISLPFFNGYHWCEEIRKISSVPVIFISSASDNMNIVMAVNMGADDFIAKPFDANVLIAKIQAMLRRTYSFNSTSSVIEHKGVVLNIDSGNVLCNGKICELSKNEYRILLLLMENKGKIVSREKIMQTLWESDEFIDENTLSVNITRLRKKLSDNGINDFIVTKFGQGYTI